MIDIGDMMYRADYLGRTYKSKVVDITDSVIVLANDTILINRKIDDMFYTESGEDTNKWMRWFLV